MKKYIKNIIPSVIIAFLTSFMIYIYEPIITYSSNVNDFWFDFKLMLPNIIMYFAIMFMVMFAIYNVIYGCSCLIKKKNVYKGALAISFILLVVAYIQGNFLAGSLPQLDGTTIQWNSYKKETIISLLVIIIVSAIEIFGIVKFKINKTIKANCFIMSAIFVMLLASFTTTLTNRELYREKVIAVSTSGNYNKISTNKNFLIFLVDAVDSAEFSSVVDTEELFKDFTYYPDTVSAYTFTRDSIPFIFSGVWNKNETEFSEYSTRAYNESAILNKLKAEGYSLNMYEPEMVWNSRKAEEIDNVKIYNDKIDSGKFYKEYTKFALYKYLPFPLKQYSDIETMDFKKCKIESEDVFYSWTNPDVYAELREKNLELNEQNYFQFVHVEGGHVPFDNDENVNVISENEGTYDQKLKATAKIINAYLQRLKDNNVYDNSVIIVMADHGYWGSNGNERQNPILYIKGIDEHHEMNVSDIPVSYEDLSEAFIQLSNGCKTEELFRNIDKDRVRKFIYNGAGIENSMREYEVRGKAWDKSAIVDNGVKYER